MSGSAKVADRRIVEGDVIEGDVIEPEDEDVFGEPEPEDDELDAVEDEDDELDALPTGKRKGPRVKAAVVLALRSPESLSTAVPGGGRLCGRPCLPWRATGWGRLQLRRLRSPVQLERLPALAEPRQPFPHIRQLSLSPAATDPVL